nr:ATP synthase F0 subunit 8 [Rhomboptera ligata]
MPQMSPLSWLSLFLFFTILLHLLMNTNFSFLKNAPHKSPNWLSLIPSIYQWKW